MIELVAAEVSLTIEQLAAESGMSVRNIRAHQARGLLAPPQVRMRVGYYGPRHLARLRLIRELQDDGFNLAAIKRLLDDSDGSAEHLERFREAIRTATRAEASQTLTLAQLGRRFSVSSAQAREVLAAAERLGVLVPIGRDRYEVPSPSLLALAEEVVRSGISLRGALELLEEVERDVDSVSRSFVRLFVQEVWQPFQRAQMPADRWPEIESAIQRLGPIASEALTTIFERRLRAAIAGQLGELAQPGGVR